MFYASQENRRKRWYRLLSFGRRKLLVLASLVVVLVLAFIALVGYYTWRASEYDLSRVVSGSGESLLYDAENKVLGSLTDSGAGFVPWEELPEDLIHAFVAREDERFFEHGGIVYSSVLRSVIRNLISWRYEQGASTITMQLTRNVYELQDKTMDRKLLEAALAQRIEKKYDKRTIFTQYVNRIYYGQNCYGIGPAAKHYFGKRVRDLDLVECATLAGLVRAPSKCNPRSDMENAMGVKRETLDRMLELDFISAARHEAAVAAPIVILPDPADAGRTQGSYAGIWAGRELEALQERIGENAGGMSVITSLNLNVQQYAESAMEKALVAVERSGLFPDAWRERINGDEEEKERQKKLFAAPARPATLKVRQQDNDLNGLLQCCVLVVDMRSDRRGRLMALVGGRSAMDGIDRWQGTLQPGRTVAPFVFSCACLPGEDAHHIVTRSAVVTGQRIGYNVVHSLFSDLKLGLELPPREEADALYDGLFDMRRLDLARILFDLVNQGKGYDLNLITTVWSRGGSPLYVAEPERAPEYIRRESAVTVSRLSPFITTAGRPTVLHERLPGGHGQFTMAFRDKRACVFVWMGFDSPDAPCARESVVQRLISTASLHLAHELLSVTLRAQQGEFPAKEKEEKKP